MAETVEGKLRVLELVVQDSLKQREKLRAVVQAKNALENSDTNMDQHPIYDKWHRACEVYKRVYNAFYHYAKECGMTHEDIFHVDYSDVTPDDWKRYPDPEQNVLTWIELQRQMNS
jgi:hypothetical protein